MTVVAVLCYVIVSEASLSHVQWTQNKSELELRHSKRGTEDGKGRGSKMAKSLSENRNFFSFNLSVAF
jgi:hypothetical protein